MRLAIPYGADHARVEGLLLDMAHRHTVAINEIGEAALRELERRHMMRRATVDVVCLPPLRLHRVA